MKSAHLIGLIGGLSVGIAAAQEPGTTLTTQVPTGSVTTMEPYPGYYVYRIDASGTATFTVDINEPLGPMGMMTAETNVYIKKGSTIIASDTGAGVPLGPGQSMTQTVNLSTYVIESGTYTIAIDCWFYGPGYTMLSYREITVTVP